MRLDGRVAVVTGAGRGLGEAIARRLAADGARLAILEMNAADGERVAADLPSARAYGVDVANLDAMSAAMARVRADFGRLDVLVNNAGITRDRTLKNMSREEWDAVISVNLSGVWNGCKAALPHLLEAGPTGRVISLSSTSYLGNFGQVNYAASKAGVVGLTRALALEVARAGVTVNAIAPGFIDTAMTRAMPQPAWDQTLASVPMQRIGQPADVANVAAFLASDDAAYVTGQVLFVCGGLSITTSKP
jgi:3-oxoacyl-[acyl-carrier protein] reductase/2-hydroxycyclohexanecarboxyl-CoA dehydrogenase